MAMIHIDRQTKTIDGVTFTNTHSGQKRAYGDSFYEYDVSSNLSAEEVERVCATQVYAAIPIQTWRDDHKAKPSADAYFRSHYVFEKRGDDKYFYQVIFPYAD